MTFTKYAKIIFASGDVHVIPVWENAMDDTELMNAGIDHGLKRDTCEFTVTIVTMPDDK